MKKFLVLSLSVSFLTSFATISQAKTQGHYAGIDLIRTKASFKERYTSKESLYPLNVPSVYSDYGIGGGLHYKYAFNFDNVFIAPSIFFEQNNTTVAGVGGNRYLNRLDIQSRYGIKTDLGYDVTEKFSPYVTGGYSRIFYKTRNYVKYINIDSTVRDSMTGDWFYGAGLNYNYNDKISFNLEYNRQRFDAKTTIVPVLDYNFDIKYRTKLEIIKLGLSYHF